MRFGNFFIQIGLQTLVKVEQSINQHELRKTT